MILEKQQLMEAGMSFSQQYSLGSNISPTIMYSIQNGRYILALNTGGVPMATPSGSPDTDAESVGKTWKKITAIPPLKKIIDIANSYVLLLPANNMGLAKTSKNNLNYSVFYGSSLSIEEQYSNGFSVTVSKKTTDPFGSTSYTTETQTYASNSILDIDGATDGTIVCATGNRGLIYSTDNGSTWKKAANNTSNLNITNVFIWSGTVSGTATKRYIALTSDGKICFTSNLTANNDNGWSISLQVLFGATIYNICQINDSVFICTSKGLYHVDPISHSVSVVNNKACYSVVKNNKGKYIISTIDGIMYSDNLSNWVKGDNITDSYLFKTRVFTTNKERIIAIKSNCSYYSEDKYVPVPFDASKPLTGVQARELVQQCKAYVQSLKS